MTGNEVTLNYQDQAACLRDSGFVQQDKFTRTPKSVASLCFLPPEWICLVGRSRYRGDKRLNPDNLV